MFSYKPLFKTLIDKDMKQEDLRLKIKASLSTMAKFRKNEYVSMKILDDICNTLNCSIDDVIEHISNKDT